MSTLRRVRRIGRTAAIGVSLSILSLLIPTAGSARQSPIEQGQEIFETTCFACHTVGGGRLVGPDLQGVTERRDEDWIISFVQRSQAVIESGDPAAVALAEEFPGLLMPDNALTDAQVRAGMAFVDEGRATTAAPVGLGPATEEPVLPGQGPFPGAPPRLRPILA